VTSVEQARLEVEELRAVARRLLAAATADRRQIERELHDGPLQHLGALSVNLQLARRLAEDDPDAAKTILEEMSRDVRHALDEMRSLAERIYPPLLEAGGLAAALRSAAASAGIRMQLEVEPGTGGPPEVAAAAYFCCAEALELAREATVTVRTDDRELVFEVRDESPGDPAAAGSDPVLARARDRVEALGGRLEIRLEPQLLVRGALPLAG